MNMEDTGMVKRILNVLVLVSVILIPGCKKDKYSVNLRMMKKWPNM